MEDLIETESLSGVYTLNKEDLKKAIRQDCITFLSFYLGEELTLEVPEFHIEIWDELLDYLNKIRKPGFLMGVLKKLFCVPREHAKSTLSKLAVILFMRYSPLKFTLYASNTKSVAMQAIKDVVKWLESPQDQELYGKVVKTKANESEGLWQIEIGTPEYGRKVITLKCVGADAQVRGTLIDNMRPELLIIDDCEDLSTASTELTQRRLDGWLFGSLLKAVSKRCLVIMLGNMISDKTALCRLSKEPDWHPTVFGCIVRDKQTKRLKPLWPGRHTLESLIEEYKSYRRMGLGHIWAHEMMNLTAESVFGSDFSNAVQIPRPNPDEIIAGALVLDPAFGTKQLNDESAITVHAILKNAHALGGGIPHVIQSVHGRFTEDEILDNLISLSLYWGINTWCIEAQAAQKLLLPLFRTALMLRNIPPESFVMIPLMTNSETKASRINAFKNSFSGASYGIVEEEGELHQLLLEYNPLMPPRRDDLVDSAAFGTVIWDQHGKLIEANGVVNVAMMIRHGGNRHKSMTELEICPF